MTTFRERQNLSAGSSLTGARFKKKLTTSDKIWGSRIVDAVISPHYTDIFDGQIEFFPAFEVLADNQTPLDKGKVPIGQNPASALYLIEFPVVTPPQFGSADLDSIDLHIYGSDTNYKNSYSLPDLEVYKFKSELPEVGKFANIRKKADGSPERIVVGSSSYSGGAIIADTFTGEGKNPVTFAFPSLYTASGAAAIPTYYSTLKEAWRIDDHYDGRGSDDRSAANKIEAYDENYCVTWDDIGRVVRYELLEHYQMVRPTGANGAKKTWGDDPRYRLPYYNYECAEKHDMAECFREELIHNKVEQDINITAADVAADVNFKKELLTAQMTTENTFFDEIHFTDFTYASTINPVTNEPNITSISFPHFSTVGSPAGGQCARLFSRIESDNPDSPPFNFRGDTSGYSHICLIKRIPKPLKMARQDNTGNELSNMRIRIKFQINNMTKSHRSGRQSGHESDIPYVVGCNILRAFSVILSTRPPQNLESFGRFLNRMNSGDTASSGNWNWHANASDGDFNANSMRVEKDAWNTATRGGYPTLSRVNAYNGVSFMNFTFGVGFDISTCTLDGTSTVLHTDTAGKTPVVGMKVSGTGIPVNTFIISTAVTSDSFEMSQPATISASDQTILFDEGRLVNDADEVASHPELQSNADNTDGTLTMFHTGQRDGATRINHWDGYYQCGAIARIDTGACDYVPIVHKQASTTAASASVSLSRDGSSFTYDQDDIFGFSPDENAYIKLEESDVYKMEMKEWFHLDGYLNMSNDYVTWVLSDMSDNVIASVQQKHSGHDLSTTINHKESMFPSFLSLWVTNIKVGKGPKSTNGLRGELISTQGFFSKVQDSEVDILINNITISNFEPKVNNATVTEGRLTIPAMKIDGAEEDTIPSLTTSIEAGEKLDSIIVNNKRACTPSYISWGAEENIWASKTNHIFMGGYSSNSPSDEDAADAEKRIKFTKTGSDANTQARFFTFLNHANNISGSGVVDYGNQNMDLGPNLNDHIDVGRSNSNAKPSGMMVDSFTKKGFITISKPTFDRDGDGTETDGIFVKVANPMFSTKIIDWDEDNPNIIHVASTGQLAAYKDDEFIIYRNGYAYGEDDYYRTGLKIKEITSSGKVTLEIFGTGGFFTYSPKYANSGAVLQKEYYKHELYISPRKYWLVAEIYNETKDNVLLPAKKYSHSVVCDNSSSPAALDITKGLTFNERKYSDTTIPSEGWFHLNSGDKTSLIETRVDYGYGNYSDGESKALDGESGLGYIQKIIPRDGENVIDLGGLVEVERGRVAQPGENIVLILKSALENKGGSAIISTKYSDSTQHPALTYIFKDEIPTINEFNVQPSEADPFFPEFTWDTEDDDLWYGFLILDTENIDNQYHKAVMHIPLNEKPSGKKDRFGYGLDSFELGQESQVYTYVAGGTDTDGNTMEIGDSDSAVLSEVSGGSYTQNLLNAVDIEGLAGNCLKFNGSLVGGESRKISFGGHRYPDPSVALSIVGHFTVDSLSLIDQQTSDKGYILYAQDSFSIWVDKNGKINASVTTDDETVTCTLISSYTVPVGNNIPTNFIFTVDTTLLTGNCKLYVNGRLEDQTGFKTTDGGVNNWKYGESINPQGYNLNIGFEWVTLASQRNYFNGKIEELVIYNIPIYPVIPKDGKITLNKPIREFTDGNVAAGRPINAKLFIKDYHNIRGTIREEVASTSQITIKKSGLGIKTRL